MNQTGGEERRGRERGGKGGRERGGEERRGEEMEGGKGEESIKSSKLELNLTWTLNNENELFDEII